MKKALIFLVLLCFIFTFTACKQTPSPSDTQSDETSNSVDTNDTSSNYIEATPVEQFTYDELNGSITITEYTGSDSVVVIPESINNVSVTQIGANAFFMNSNLVSIVLPNTVTSIGIMAFENCKALKKVVLPENLENIGGCAFSNCENLYDITLPNSVKEIGGQAFLNCKSLKDVTIPKNCHLGVEAFHKSGLENLTLEPGITYIPDNCFAGTNIQKLDLPQTVQTIERGAFGDCSNLKKVTLNEGLVDIGSEAFYGANIEEIIIPSTVTGIWDTTFSECSNLDKIKFEGDAPKEFVLIFQGVSFPAKNVHFTVFYHSNTSGFASPEWNGYPTKIW